MLVSKKRYDQLTDDAMQLIATLVKAEAEKLKLKFEIISLKKQLSNYEEQAKKKATK